jgi:hypothetical protein
MHVKHAPRILIDEAVMHHVLPGLEDAGCRMKIVTLLYESLRGSIRPWFL